MAIIAVVILIVAGAGVYMVLGGGDDKGESSDVYAVDVNGVVAEESNVLNGTYPIQRELVLCTKGEASGNAAAFISWILSTEGQEIISGEFVALENPSKTYTDPVGDVNLTIGGSTTIQPIMNKLVEAYKEKYSDRTVNITVNGGGSGVGASNTINGTFDIGMCSRNLSDSEKAQGLVETKIALDGVAVIVNGAGVDNLTMEQIAKIFSGDITNWNQVGGVDKQIAVVIRDDASGTRECFDKAMAGVVEGWEVKDGVPEQNSTNGVITLVSSTPGAIGYVSIGALKELDNEEDTGVHATSVDGIAAEESNVLNGTYPIQRELVLCTKGDATGNAAAFISWILSTEGQEIISGEFVALENPSETYTDPVGDVNLTIGGSTTIQPIMNKLVEAYKEKYSDRNVNIQVNGGGSGVGASNTINGSFDIGMCSRNLSDSEKAQGLVETKIALDGVAVIVNGVSVKDLTMEQIAKIFSGEITNWNQVGGPDKDIAVVVRDDASGTRECFDKAMEGVIEGWELKDGVPEQNSTNGVITLVSSTPGAIGYVSIGALKDI